MTTPLTQGSERMLKAICETTHAPPPIVIERAIMTLYVAMLGPVLLPITTDHNQTERKE